MKNLKKINQKSLFFIAGVLVVVAVIVSLNLSDKVFGATGGGGGGGAGGGEIDGGAGATCTLTGFAWSGYKDKSGIGWIGFGPQNNFRVVVDSDGLLNGHAWIGDNTAVNDNGEEVGAIGWVKFGGLSGFPNGGGTKAVNATLDWESGKMSGWARACSAAPNPETCSGQGAHPNAGGWDGWISLSGTTADGDSYDVSWNSGTQQFEGYAWGSKEVAGWISFAGNNPNYGVTFTTNTCKGSIGDGGGGGFDYSVDIPNLVLTVPAQGSLNHPVFISLQGGSSQEVKIENVSDNPSPFVTVSAAGDKNSCDPDCTVELLVSYDLSSYNGVGENLSYTITTKSDGLSDKTSPFIITIRVLSDELSCAPHPTFALVGQEVTWTADPGNLKNVVSYDWSGDELEETTIEPERSVKVKYNSVGHKNAKVDVYYNCTGDVCETKSAQCSPSVQVFSDILFEHL